MSENERPEPVVITWEASKEQKGWMEALEWQNTRMICQDDQAEELDANFAFTEKP